MRRAALSLSRPAGAAARRAPRRAALGAGGAEYVRRLEAPQGRPPLPIDNFTAALLVFVPGAVGALLAGGFALSLRGKRGVILAALAGVLGALAVTTCLVEH